MIEKIALHRMAETIELQLDVLGCLILRVGILEAQIEQMQRTVGKPRRRSIKVLYRGSYEDSRTDVFRN